jgi:hypothetical protein
MSSDLRVEERRAQRDASRNPVLAPAGFETPLRGPSTRGDAA